MGLRFFKRRNRRRCCAGSVRAKSFNGAALFQAQKSQSVNTQFFLASCFNGAALFQAQKLTQREKIYRYWLQLQWGCAFSSAEIPWATNTNRKTGNRLQWGCAFSSAEMTAITTWLVLCVICFNGAALFQAQKCQSCSLTFASGTRASMGLRFFKRRNKILDLNIIPQLYASMGLRFFKRRNNWK